MNFLKSGGSSSLKSLDDVALFKNSFARGATQDAFSDFEDESSEMQNSKYALGAAINVIGFSKGMEGYADYSGGANSWDGIDLVSSKWSNIHRKYSWSADSKALLKEYKKDAHGGVNVTGFTYKKTGFQISATRSNSI